MGRGDERPQWDAVKSHKGPAAKGDKHRQKQTALKWTVEPGKASHLSRELLCEGDDKGPVSSLSTEEGAPEKAYRMCVEHDGEDILEAGWRNRRQSLAAWRNCKCALINCIICAISDKKQLKGERVCPGSQSEGIQCVAVLVWAGGSWSLCFVFRKRLWWEQVRPQSSRSVLQRSSSNWSPPPNGSTTSPNSAISWEPGSRAYEVGEDILHPHQNTWRQSRRDSSGSKDTGVNIHSLVSWKEMEVWSLYVLSWSLLCWGWDEVTHIFQNLLYDRLSACLIPLGSALHASSHWLPTAILPPWVVLSVCKESIVHHL